MKNLTGLFADASNLRDRFIPDFDRIAEIREALRTLGHTVVLTSGTFDLLHEGHSAYLEAARNFGDFLIVGVDSDARARARKGPNRPLVPQIERMRMVTHQRGVGLVTLKNVEDKPRALIETVKPDVLVVTKDTYTTDEIADLEEFSCSRVQVLPRMSTVSTSARLRRALLQEQ